MKKPFDLSDLTTMTGLIDTIFSEMNIGLMIFQIEDVNEASTLRLVYANKQADKYTGADLGKLIGKYIFEAFPKLNETDVAQIYAEALRTNQPRTVGVLEYSDENVTKGYYAVKAFPMPNDCVGVLFENVTLRKQLDEMIKNRAEKPANP